MQGLAHASSRFHLSVYAFNPDSRAPDQPADALKAPATGTLEWLAQQTGGDRSPLEAISPAGWR